MVWLEALIGIYILLLLLISWISIHPIRIPIYLSPGGLGAPQEEIEFVSRDGIPLRGWWVEAENARTVAIFVHGYLMNRCELTPEAYLLWKEGISCLLLDERAHGRSGGKRSTMGANEALDVIAAAAFARSRTPNAKIVLIGSSMGAAAALMALAFDPRIADAIVLDSCYSRFTSAILGWWRFLGGRVLSIVLAPTALLAWPFTGVNPFTVDMAKTIGQIDGKPVLFMHGSRDNLALPEGAARNFEAAAGPKTIVWFEGCGHSEGRWLQPEKYRAALLNFLRENSL